jgi:hypothetical protein
MVPPCYPGSLRCKALGYAAASFIDVDVIIQAVKLKNDKDPVEILQMLMDFFCKGVVLR